jgi:hypothetical protein
MEIKLLRAVHKMHIKMYIPPQQGILIKKPHITAAVGDVYPVIHLK